VCDEVLAVDLEAISASQAEAVDVPASLKHYFVGIVDLP